MLSRFDLSEQYGTRELSALAQSFAPALPYPPSEAPAGPLRAAEVLVMAGLILNGFIPRLVSLGRSDTVGLPVPMLDLLVIGAAVGLLAPGASALRFDPPRKGEIATAALALVPSAAIGWAAVCLFGLANAWRSQGAARLGWLLLAGLGATTLWDSVVGLWLASFFGALDAFVVSKLLGLVYADAFVDGNVVGAGPGHALIMFWGCATASFLPKLMVVQAAVCAYLARRPWQAALVCVPLTATVATLCNWLRLAAMATSPTLYANIHNPVAESLFDTLLIGIVFAVSFVGRR